MSSGPYQHCGTSTADPYEVDEQGVPNSCSFGEAGTVHVSTKKNEHCRPIVSNMKAIATDDTLIAGVIKGS